MASIISLRLETFPCPDGIGHADGAKALDPDGPPLLMIDHDLFHRDSRHEADKWRPHSHPYGQAAQIPRRMIPCSCDGTLERRRLGRDLMIQDRTRPDNTSSPRSGRDNPIHVFQMNDQGPVIDSIADASSSRLHVSPVIAVATWPVRQEDDRCLASRAPQCESFVWYSPPPTNSRGPACPAAEDWL